MSPAARMAPTIMGISPFSLGANAWVYRISDDVALKSAREDTEHRFEQEGRILRMMEQHEPCPFVIQSFYYDDRFIFQPYMSGGTLDGRMRSNQQRNGPDFVSVLKWEETSIVERWVAELSAGVAWLELLSLAHCDLRPENILLDLSDHIKLIDFDCAEPIGTPSYGGAPPWTRLRPEHEDGPWGVYGPETEQFAIGSLAYYMSRGSEPYELVADGPEVVDLLRDRKFPALDLTVDLDTIIDKCWWSRYPSIRDLADATSLLKCASDMSQAKVLSPEYCRKRRAECVAMLESHKLK